MPTVNAGSILIAQTTGSWVNEQNWELTGTVAPGDVVAPYQLYLGAGASSVSGYYVGYYITTSLFTDLGQYYNCQVTAYNSTTKVATVGWTSADASPPIGTQWRCFIMFPVLSSYQWKRDGVDITGEITRVYTTTAADIGSTISFNNIGGSVPKGTSPTVITKPTATTTNQSSLTYSVSGPAPSGNFINSSSDFTLLGAMRLYNQYTGGAFDIVPASKSPSGQKCLYVAGAGPYIQNAQYLTIPTLTQNYSTDWNSFPPGSICQIITSQANIFGSKFGIGVPQGADTVRGARVLDSNYLITSYASSYDQNPYPMSVMARRPANLTTSNPVDLFALYDPLATTTRWRSGAISEVPSQYVTALGGDIMVACAGLSIHSTLSQGPASFVFKSSDIAPALTKAASGTSVSGTSTTMVLDTNANTSTTDFYKNCYLVVGSSISILITAYNASTRTVTVANPILPTVSSAYQIIPSVIGKQLIGYSSPFFASDAYGAIWDLAGVSSSAVSSVIVNNTKSLLCSINAIYGLSDYGISVDARPNGVGGGARLYNPYVAGSGNADQNSHFYLKNGGVPAQIIVYSTDDVATVSAGEATYSSLTPKAIFNLPFPYSSIAMGLSMQFDNTDGKLYVMADLSNPSEFPYPVVLVYQCNKWS